MNVTLAQMPRRLYEARSCVASPGWLLSRLRGRPVDALGRPLPWLTYSAIAALKAGVRPGLKVFEFGSGYSTAWWLRQGCSVVACESSEPWAKEVRSIAPEADVRVRSVEDGSYSQELVRTGQRFDVVVIDGSCRVDCARVAPGALAPDGVVIFDDTNVEDYADGISALRRSGLVARHFPGFAPAIGHRKTTTAFLRHGNCLGL